MARIASRSAAFAALGSSATRVTLVFPVARWTVKMSTVAAAEPPMTSMTASLARSRAMRSSDGEGPVTPPSRPPARSAITTSNPSASSSPRKRDNVSVGSVAPGAGRTMTTVAAWARRAHNDRTTGRSPNPMRLTRNTYGRRCRARADPA